MRQFILFSLALILCSCASTPFKPLKFNGVSFVASRDSVLDTHIEPIKNINANAAAVMPFGFIRDLNHPEIIYNTDRQWFGESKLGAKQYIKKLQEANMRVMLKPQIWVRGGEFTGKITMNTEESWLELERTYSNFILDFAELAESTKVDIFCIGTELELFIKYRPNYWFKLIEKIRTVYSGELTYAANWDEFWRTPFWNKLDFIGIDGYFPLSDLKTPTVEDCKKGWLKYKTEMKQFSEAQDRQILFTEYGYRSVDYAAKQPWLVERSENNTNLEAQTNALTALYEEVWGEDWFAGGFIWKWFINHPRSGGPDNNRFTPQNKPAEKVVSNYYARF